MGGRISQDGRKRFDGGVVGLDAHRVVPEMERIALETKKALDEATSPQDRAMAIACFHARYRRAHPFLDGNTRTSAVLLEAQIQTIFPLENRRVQERPEDYKLKLAQAYQGDIAPLTNHILAVTGHSLIEAIHVKCPRLCSMMILKPRSSSSAKELSPNKRGSGPGFARDGWGGADYGQTRNGHPAATVLFTMF